MIIATLIICGYLLAGFLVAAFIFTVIKILEHKVIKGTATAKEKGLMRAVIKLFEQYPVSYTAFFITSMFVGLPILVIVTYKRVRGGN